MNPIVNKQKLFPPFSEELDESPSNTCPICGTYDARFARGLVSRYSVGDDGVVDDQIQGFCQTCSNFWTTTQVVEDARKKKRVHLLCAYLRSLPHQFWKNERGPILPAEWEDLVASIAPLSVSEQFDEAIVVVCKQCPEPGAISKFSPWYDWPLLRTQSADAASYIIRELGELGYMKRADDGEIRIPPIPTWKAYERVEKLESSGRQSTRAFVAMSFSKSQEDVWLRIIKPGIEDAGYKPVRVDKEEHSERIDDFILAEIRRSRFLVADFTQQRNGVYFEAGFALGLGRKVIWMCDGADAKNLHFDTRQFNHIIYTGHEQSKKQLTARIVALEGEGPNVSE